MNIRTALGPHFIRVKDCPDLVLSQSGGKLRLAWRDANDANQRWMVSGTLDKANCYWFTNEATGTGLCAPGDDNGDVLTLSGQGEAWYVGGALSNAFNVVRTWTNENRNLNALGGWPYDTGNAVGVWGWGGGNGNELWQVIRTSNWPNPEPRHYVIIYNHTSLTVQDGDLGGTQPLACGGTISVPPGNDRVIFEKIVSPGFGFALRNKYNGKYIYWNGPNQPLGQSAIMSLRCLWTSVITNGNANAIRPYLDANQNWDIYGNPANEAGVPIYTWSWANGANQKWQILDLQARFAQNL